MSDMKPGEATCANCAYRDWRESEMNNGRPICKNPRNQDSFGYRVYPQDWCALHPKLDPMVRVADELGRIANQLEKNHRIREQEKEREEIVADMKARKGY